MPSDQPIPVPSNVLTYLLHGASLDTARLLLDTWRPGDVAHPGDPFGTVFLWLWRTDQDRAVRFFSDMLWQVRRTQPDATKQITLNGVLNGLAMAAQGIAEAELAEMEPRLLQWLQMDHAEDPNATS
jgi:hypothetical protein